MRIFMSDINIILNDGKYEYNFADGKQTILRHGEPWRDETGDNLLLAMANMIVSLEEELGNIQEKLDNLPVDLDEIVV